MNLPKLVTRLRARAILPSSMSVSDASANTASAAYCAHAASISAKITKMGIMQMRSMESLLGRFISTPPQSTSPVRSYASAPVMHTCTYSPGFSARWDSSQMQPSLSGAS